MSDLIDRQAAIIALLEKGQKSRRYKLGEFWELNFDEIREALATVPSAEPAWIPVTERLPHYGNYLVSFRTDEEIDIGTYDPKTGLWTACDANGMYYVASKGLEVIAWAPLPKPYKEWQL